MATHLDRGRLILGRERDKVRQALAAKYEAGASIRTLAAETGKSYGFVHKLLGEAEVTFRARGGNVRAHRSNAGAHPGRS